MYSEPLCPPGLSGAESTAELIKSWLIDEKRTRSGLLGVSDVLQVTSVRTFQHGLSESALSLALDEAVRASATGVVAYEVVEGRPSFNADLIGNFTRACESLNVTLLDVMLYSPHVPKGWLSARQRDLLR